MAALSDDLLEEILVRVASTADLARASTACASFRRVITDPVFLRRYRSLHRPLVLGLVNVGVNGATTFDPSEAPSHHPGAPAGRAFARAADFSFSDYVPPAGSRWGGAGWYPNDFCDGRVLLECCCCCPGGANDDDREGGVLLPDLAVCDPLSRRYLLLPPIPDGRAYEQDLDHYCVFFAPSVADDEDDDETSFRVMMEMRCTEELVVVVFSSSSGTWSLRASTTTTTSSSENLCAPCDAYNCLYWKVARANELVKLDMSTEEFSTVHLPLGHEQRIVLLLEEGDGKLGMFSYHERSESSLARYYTSCAQKEGKIVIANNNEWQLKNERVPLPTHVYGLRSSVCEPRRYIFMEDYESRCFMLDFKTMASERVGTAKWKWGDVHPYLGYPPFMSPRRI